MSLRDKLGEYVPLLARKPGLPREKTLTLRPTRNPTVLWTPLTAGDEDIDGPRGVSLTVPIKKDKLGKAITRLFALPNTKTIELDEFGGELWAMCDGHHTVEQFVGHTSRKYQLNRRQAEVSVLAFLRMLLERRLVGFLAADLKPDALKGNEHGTIDNARVPDESDADLRGAPGGDIRTQINLPWSKAITIAMNSLKIRFWRSLITAAGIFLGIAFLAFSYTSMQLDQGGAEAHNRQIWLLVMSFLVSTIGIMNSMLMSVSERFREIGTMKCLGALNSLIVRLFIIEAVFMGIIASLAGWVLGFLGVLLVHSIQGTGKPLTPALALESFGLCIVVGAVITLLAALLPALRAAQMPPAAALRTEV